MVRVRIAVRYLSVLVGLFVLLPSDAAGQAAVNPTRALFNASTDHNATDSGGTPVVQSYEIGLYIVGASQPFQRVSIGKPTPDGTGTITVDMTSAFVGWPIVGTTYTADVAAIGPGGIARSALSNTFSFTGGGSCIFGVSPTAPNVPAASGTHTASVTTASGCAWTGVRNSTWITVTGGSTGAGNGTVTYSVTANTSTSPRTGTLTIAGQTVTVTQAGACSFTLAPTSVNVGAGGGAQTATVTTTSGCGWSAVSHNPSWMTITGGSSGTGSGTVTYNVTATTSARTGTLTIAGQILTVTQSGACTANVLVTSQTATASGGSLTNTVTSGTGCAWTAVSNVNWITITSGASGTGNGTSNYTVAANTSLNSRSGTLTIGGRTVTVTQSGRPSNGVSPPRNIRVKN